MNSPGFKEYPDTVGVWIEFVLSRPRRVVEIVTVDPANGRGQWYGPMPTPEDPGLTVAEIEAVAMSEYKHWRDAADSDTGSAARDAIADAISMGAMGAAANIFSAIHGHRAPWHPQPQKGI